jgi:hypothetical protein
MSRAETPPVEWASTTHLIRTTRPCLVHRHLRSLTHVLKHHADPPRCQSQCGMCNSTGRSVGSIDGDASPDMVDKCRLPRRNPPTRLFLPLAATLTIAAARPTRRIAAHRLLTSARSAGLRGAERVTRIAAHGKVPGPLRTLAIAILLAGIAAPALGQSSLVGQSNAMQSAPAAQPPAASEAGQAPAELPQTNHVELRARIHRCAVQWRNMKASGADLGTTWADFSSVCLTAK